MPDKDSVNIPVELLTHAYSLIDRVVINANRGHHTTLGFTNMQMRDSDLKNLQETRSYLSTVLGKYDD